MPFLFHSWVTLAALALCGAASSTEPVAGAAVAGLWLLFYLKSHRPIYTLRSLGVVSLGLVLAGTCFWRASTSLASYKRNYHSLRAQFPEPRRCVGSGTVVSSPTQRTRPPADDHPHSLGTIAQAPSSEPPSLNAHLPQQTEQLTLYSVRFLSLDCEGSHIPGPISARLSGKNQLVHRGDEVEVFAQLAPTRLFRNALLPNPWPGAARSGAALSGSALHVQVLSQGRSLLSLIDRFRSRVRKRIQSTYSPVTVPLGRALVLGESDLPMEDASAFRKSGLLHLLAVSGTHLVIFVLTMVRTLRAILVRIHCLAKRGDLGRWSSAWGALCSLLYADFSGGSGSAWRAAYMLCVVCGGRAFGFRITGATALGASLLIGQSLDPHAVFDFSFLLSALATSGLIGLGQPLSRFCTRSWASHGPMRLLVESLCATVASTIPCAPVLAMMDDSMTWAALLANVVAAPLGEVIALPACLLHAVVPVFPALEKGLALLGSGALYGVRAVALTSASLKIARFQVPFPRSSSLSQLIFLALFLVFVAHAMRQYLQLNSNAWNKLPSKGFTSTRAQIWALSALSLVFILGWAHSPGQESARQNWLTVTALDVGQGDALLVEFPTGQIAVIDGGGFATKMPDTGARVVLPYLRSRGISHIDLMIASHAHPDHILGLLTVAQKVPVSTLWIPDTSRDLDIAASFKNHPHSGYMGQLVREVSRRGGSIKSSARLCDLVQHFGGALIDVLAPCAPSSPALGLNDGSLVLRIRHHKKAVLLTGDIEKRGEALLLDQPKTRQLLRADLLKVAHHGSDTSSSPAFIRAVAPHVAFISSGVRNSFRHPRPSTLQTLKRYQVNVLRTDQQGSITWSTDGTTEILRSFDPPPNHSSIFSEL